MDAPEPHYKLCDRDGCHAYGAESALVLLPPKGEHKDAGKDRLDLLPREGLRAASRALAHGISTGKYEAHNYVRGLLWMALVGSILRHVFRWVWDGRPDEESGLSDLDHAAADVLMLAEIVARHPDLDDRPCKKFPPVGE